MRLTSSGLSKVGVWNTTAGLNMTIKMDERERVYDDGSMRNKTFTVITALVCFHRPILPIFTTDESMLQSPPYGMLKDSSDTLIGNARFEGFGIELIQELSEIYGFNYNFVLQEDKDYGEWNNETQQWTGMIKALLDEVSSLKFWREGKFKYFLMDFKTSGGKFEVFKFLWNF